MYTYVGSKMLLYRVENSVTQDKLIKLKLMKRIKYSSDVLMTTSLLLIQSTDWLSSEHFISLMDFFKIGS